MVSEEFDKKFLAYFGASRGAFSPITDDEFRKSQVTFVGPEQALAEAYFGDRLNSHRGSIDDIRKAGHDPELKFRKFPSGEEISLTVSYKTGKPKELRYYLRRDIFKPNPGENWGIFERAGEIWLCHFSNTMKEKIKAGEFFKKERADILEPENDDYQDTINAKATLQTETTIKRWSRDPNIALKALARGGYKCELFPEWPTFLAKTTNKPFMESHHLVPMKQQEAFNENYNLDCVENICILNPLAHRMLHHAKFDDIVEPLRKLIKPRSKLIAELNLVEDDIFGFYC